MPRNSSSIQLKRALTCGAFICVALLGSCSLNKKARSVAQNFADGGLEYLNSDSGRKRIRVLVDTSFHTIGQSFRAQLKPVADSAVQQILERGESAIDRAESSLVVWVDSQLSGAFTRLVRTNLEVAGKESRTQLDLTVRRLSHDLEQDLTPVLRRSVTAATQSLMTQLSASLRTELREAAESALAGAVRAGIKAGGEEATKTPVWRTIVYIAVGVAVLIVVGWFVRNHRRAVTALDVVTREVTQFKDPTLKAHIQERAVDRQIDPWLRGFLSKRGYI